MKNIKKNINKNKLNWKSKKNDPNGSYTGLNFNEILGEFERPIQDADDL